jgi:type I restriction enzyme, S subunit
MTRSKLSLGELCTLVKGSSPISKTPPGDYPLVTTGEEDKTSNSFQFASEAVCIPLVSSTGHGHASIKRVHYRSGKFALSNLLAAAIVKDESILSPKYLARYLMASKDRLIVPLMTGAANMSLSLARLSTVPIEFPSLGEQARITSLLDDMDELRVLRAKVNMRTSSLVPAIFFKMFGEPGVNNKCWPSFKLSELAAIVTGNTPSRTRPEFFGKYIEWIKTNNIDPMNGVVTSASEHLSQEGARYGRIVPAGSILVTCIAGSRGLIGNAAVTDRPVAINQQINAIVPNPLIDSVFLCQQIMALKGVIQQKINGNMTGIINKSALESIMAICPPIELQREFSSHVAEIRLLEAEQRGSLLKSEMLIDSANYCSFI